MSLVSLLDQPVDVGAEALEFIEWEVGFPPLFDPCIMIAFQLLHLVKQFPLPPVIASFGLDAGLYPLDTLSNIRLDRRGLGASSALSGLLKFLTHRSSTLDGPSRFD